VREELAKRDGLRGRFFATFVRFGTKTAYRGAPIKTCLLRDVKDEAGTIVTDHLWMVCGIQLERLEMKPGDIIYFMARVSVYTKGYRGRREDDDLPPLEQDYRLSFPTNMQKKSTTPEITGDLFAALG
jgi:hypothetical protein